MALVPPYVSAPVVLVADPHGDTRAVWRHALVLDGFQVVEASSGREAIALAASHKPAVVISHAHFSDLDGIEACRQVRAVTAPHVPRIVLVTGTPLLPAAGAEVVDAILLTPCIAETLVAIVRRLLGSAPGRSGP